MKSAIADGGRIVSYRPAGSSMRLSAQSSLVSSASVSAVMSTSV
jgi:hypothetical protein